MVFRRRTPATRKRAPRGKYARKYTKRPAARKSMVSLIKSVIHKQAENKVREFNASTALSNYADSSVGWNSQNVIPLTPQSTYLEISQGTGQGGRIGNKISVRKAFIKFVMYPRAYDAVNNVAPVPQDVRVVILKSKDDPTNILSQFVMSGFFQYGNTYNAPSGLLADMVRDINTDLYTVHYDKIYKIGNSSVSGTGNQAGSQYFLNNDYKMNKIMKLDITKFYPKVVTFNDNTTIPVCPTLQMLIFPVNANGTQGQLPLYWNYNLHLEYEDM